MSSTKLKYLLNKFGQSSLKAAVSFKSLQLSSDDPVLLLDGWPIKQ